MLFQLEGGPETLLFYQGQQCVMSPPDLKWLVQKDPRPKHEGEFIVDCDPPMDSVKPRHVAKLLAKYGAKPLDLLSKTQQHSVPSNGLRNNTAHQCSLQPVTVNR